MPGLINPVGLRSSRHDFTEDAGNKRFLPSGPGLNCSALLISQVHILSLAWQYGNRAGVKGNLFLGSKNDEKDIQARALNRKDHIG